MNDYRPEEGTTRSKREGRSPGELRIAVKALAFTIIVPGTVIILVPYWILSGVGSVEWPAVSLLSAPSGILALLGIGLLGHSIWGFALHGHGTPAPIDPPKVLVIRGLYRHTRNPMYLGVLFTLMAETLFFKNAGILIYTGVIFLGFHLFVTHYEEPTLRARFGKKYEEYCRAIPRWGFVLRKFESADHSTEGARSEASKQHSG